MQGLGELEALVMDVLWRSTEPVRVARRHRRPR